MKRTSLALFLIATAAFAGGKKPVTEPGTYKSWGPDIDQMEIVMKFQTSDYESIAVLPFDTSKTPLPEEKAKSYESVKTVLAEYTGRLAGALQKELKAKVKVEEVAKAPTGKRTLVLRGTVEDISPGSRAKRYVAGFGAGAAGTKITGELVDASTGAVLLRFVQERRSGGTWKFAGGNDQDVMRDSIHAVGQDIAHILDSF